MSLPNCTNLTQTILKAVSILKSLIAIREAVVIVERMFFVICKYIALVARNNNLSPYKKSFISSISNKVKEYS